jgi:hypothetical protein
MTDVDLEAGVQVLKMIIISGGFTLDSIEIDPIGNSGG